VKDVQVFFSKAVERDISEVRGVVLLVVVLYDGKTQRRDPLHRPVGQPRDVHRAPVKPVLQQE